MENRKTTEAGQHVTMQKEDFAALWKTIHLKVTDTYEVPPEILWVNVLLLGWKHGYVRTRSRRRRR